MALIDLLQRAHWAKRVLFPVDRVALRDQAIDAFREHLRGSPIWPSTKGHREETAWASYRHLYCTTYQTMRNLIEAGTTRESFISPHFFDLIIADESHRSVYDAYGAVLDWFTGIRLGLTATPRDQPGHDTFQLFDCDLRDPTFAFDYEAAVAHHPPYLCRYKVLEVRSKFQLVGIKAGVLPPELQMKLVRDGIDPALVDFEGTDIERSVSNSGTNELLVREFVDSANKDPTGTLPGKTIVFAMSKEHARRLTDLFNKAYSAHGGLIAQRLVDAVERLHGKGGLLDQFKHENMPRIAVTVDLLDTGVDIPEVVNLVFAKPVFSYM